MSMIPKSENSLNLHFKIIWISEKFITSHSSFLSYRFQYSLQMLVLNPVAHL